MRGHNESDEVDEHKEEKTMEEEEERVVTNVQIEIKDTSKWF